MYSYYVSSFCLDPSPGSDTSGTETSYFMFLKMLVIDLWGF